MRYLVQKSTHYPTRKHYVIFFPCKSPLVCCMLKQERLIRNLECHGFAKWDRRQQRKHAMFQNLFTSLFQMRLSQLSSCFENYLIFDVVLTDMQNIYLVCIEFHCISCHFECNVRGQIVLKIAEMKLTVTLLCSHGSKTDF